MATQNRQKLNALKTPTNTTILGSHEQTWRLEECSYLSSAWMLQSQTSARISNTCNGTRVGSKFTFDTVFFINPYNDSLTNESYYPDMFDWLVSRCDLTYNEDISAFVWSIYYNCRSVSINTPRVYVLHYVYKPSITSIKAVVRFLWNKCIDNRL